MGCSKTILNQNFLSKIKLSKGDKFKGKVHQCIGSEVMTLEVDSIKVHDEVILVDFRPFGVDMMLRMSSIKLLAVSISPLAKAKFGSSYCGAAEGDGNGGVSSRGFASGGGVGEGGAGGSRGTGNGKAP